MIPAIAVPPSALYVKGVFAVYPCAVMVILSLLAFTSDVATVLGGVRFFTLTFSPPAVVNTSPIFTSDL